MLSPEIQKVSLHFQIINHCFTALCSSINEKKKKKWLEFESLGCSDFFVCSNLRVSNNVNYCMLKIQFWQINRSLGLVIHYYCKPSKWFALVKHTKFEGLYAKLTFRLMVMPQNVTTSQGVLNWLGLTATSLKGHQTTFSL